MQKNQRQIWAEPSRNHYQGCYWVRGFVLDEEVQSWTQRASQVPAVYVGGHRDAGIRRSTQQDTRWGHQEASVSQVLKCDWDWQGAELESCWAKNPRDTQGQICLLPRSCIPRNPWNLQTHPRLMALKQESLKFNLVLCYLNVYLDF